MNKEVRLIMKKIMFMANSLDGGGAEKILQTVLLNLNESKYDVTVYSMHRENIATLNYPKFIHYKVVFDTYSGDNLLKKKLNNLCLKLKGKLFQYFPSNVFYRLIVHEKYDVEIAFIEGESTKIVSGSSNRYSKKYAWVHIDLEENPWTSFLYQSENDECEHYKKFNKILCVSESVKKAFLTKFNSIENEKVQVQYNPINRDEIISMAKKEYPGVNIKEKQSLRMVAVGRLVKQKGFDRLIKICSRLDKEGYNFELFILGEGEERIKLEKMIKEMHFNNTVKMLGFINNPYSIMATADVLVCSSRSEGFSTVLSEGVVLGLPIISTECAGVSELFGEKECGQIVNNDSESLYYALKQVLEHPEKLSLYRKESFERGKDFDLSKTMSDIEKLLDE